jgi:hypothetical protein
MLLQTPNPSGRFLVLRRAWRCGPGHSIDARREDLINLAPTVARSKSHCALRPQRLRGATGKNFWTSQQESLPPTGIASPKGFRECPCCCNGTPTPQLQHWSESAPWEGSGRNHAQLRQSGPGPIRLQLVAQLKAWSDYQPRRRACARTVARAHCGRARRSAARSRPPRTQATASTGIAGLGRMR